MSVLKKIVFDKLSENFKKSDVKFNGILALFLKDQLELDLHKGKLGNPSVSSLFLIGSISKQITAAIVLKILAENKISTNELIAHYLPSSQTQFLDKVKIKHLFNHTAGILNLNVPLQSEPGELFSYSPTLGYFLLTQIAEKISGKNFSSLLQIFLNYYNLSNTGIPSTRYISEIEKDISHFNPGFKETKNGEIIKVLEFADSFTNSDLSWQPGGGYFSTATDLARWNFLLHNSFILEKDSYMEFIKPSAQRNVAQRGLLGYGYGIQILEDVSFIEYSHSGYLNGYTSSLFYFPQLQISLIILENVNWYFAKPVSPFCNHLKFRDDVIKSIL